MKRILAVAGILVALSAGAWAQSPDSFDEVINRSIVQENKLLQILRGLHPIAETYIQNMVKDADFGAVPKSDNYFLGKIDLTNGVNSSSFIPKSGGGRFRIHPVQAFKQLFSIRYLPRGFAQMMLLDGADFDREHYDFEFVRREFLGDVRTYVVSVRPKKSAGKGRS